MVTTAEAIATLYPTAIPFTDWLVRQDSHGTSITVWNTGKLGPQPSPATLAAVTDAQVTAAVAAARDAKGPDLATLRDQADAAVTAIDTYLAIASPSNAQLIAELRKVDQRQRAILKALKYLATALL